MKPASTRSLAGPVLVALGALLGLFGLLVTDALAGELAQAELDLGLLGVGVVGGLVALRFGAVALGVVVAAAGLALWLGGVAKRPRRRRKTER